MKKKKVDFTKNEIRKLIFIAKKGCGLTCFNCSFGRLKKEDENCSVVYCNTTSDFYRCKLVSFFKDILLLPAKKFSLGEITKKTSFEFPLRAKRILRELL